MSIVKKILIIIMAIILIFSTMLFIPKVYAAHHQGSGGSSQYADGLGNLETYKGTDTGSQKLEEKAGVILGAIRAIGIVASVTMLIAIGIKFMLGSVEERVEYKKSLVPYVVGAFLVFTGSLVPQLIFTFFNS